MESTRLVAEKIRDNIQNHEFPQIKHSVTARLGMSQHTGNESIDKTIARADIALYRAKENGRNRSEIELS